MLANIKITKSTNVVSISLPNDQVIIGKIDEKDHMHILLNTSGLDTKLAECVAGVAWTTGADYGQDTVVWNRLLSTAKECKKRIEKMRLNIN
jgi:hypothetical protein